MGGEQRRTYVGAARWNRMERQTGWREMKEIGKEGWEGGNSWKVRVKEGWG